MGLLLLRGEIREFSVGLLRNSLNQLPGDAANDRLRPRMKEPGEVDAAGRGRAAELTGLLDQER
jgi:hypothetical protein